MKKTLDYYLALPYTFELQNDPEDAWFVRVKELPGCMSQGDTSEEAMEMIRESMELWLEIALEDGDPIPEPRELDDYSGKFVVRVPRSLHRDLVETADHEGVSLNQYITVALGRAVGQPGSRSAGRLVGAMPGDAASDTVPFRQYVPGGQWSRAASTVQEESDPYSMNEAETSDSRDADPTKDVQE
jgi:antitoxin HicB